MAGRSRANTQAAAKSGKTGGPRKRRTSNAGRWAGRRAKAKPCKKEIRCGEVSLATVAPEPLPPKASPGGAKRAAAPSRQVNEKGRHVASRRDIASRDVGGGRQTDLLSFGFSSSVSCRQQDSDEQLQHSTQESLLGPTQMWVAPATSPAYSPTQPADESDPTRAEVAFELEACSPTQLVFTDGALQQIQGHPSSPSVDNSRPLETVEVARSAWQSESSRMAGIAEPIDGEDDLPGPTQLWGAALQAISPSPSPSPPQRPSSSASAIQARPARSPSPTASYRAPSPKRDLSMRGRFLLDCSPTQAACLERRMSDDCSPTQPWNEPER